MDLHVRDWDDTACEVLSYWTSKFLGKALVNDVPSTYDLCKSVE